MPLYRAAKADFGRVMHRTIGVASAEAIETLELLDRENVKRFGFSARRFPTSMAESYVRLAAAAGRKTDPRVRDQVHATAVKIFTLPARRILGAKRVLSILRAEGYLMVLCTKGDRDVQRFRISTSGVSQFFDRVFIVRQKSERQFRTILRELEVDPKDACSIGDSVRSDINPALHLRMSAVWAKKPTWSFETERPAAGGHLRVISALGDLPATLKSIHTASARGHAHERSKARLRSLEGKRPFEHRSHANSLHYC